MKTKNKKISPEQFQAYYDEMGDDSQNNDGKALRVARKMRRFAPHNTRILFSLAACLENCENFEEAICVYKDILASRDLKIVSDFDLSGVELASSLKNDCRYRIAECYYALGEYSKAIRLVKKYHQNADNCVSEFSKKETKEFYVVLENKIVSRGNTNKIEKYFDEDNWVKARELLLIELKKNKDDAWLLTRLSTTYYEQYDYKKALEISIRAFAILPSDPLVIWDYAGALSMLGEDKQAINFYKMIVRMDLNKIAFFETGNGLRWAKSIVNDSRFRIGLCFLDLKNQKQAKKWIEEHLKNRKKGLPSLYSKKEIISNCP